MEENKNLLEEYQQDTKLPQMLNVLTILTFIGSGFGALGILAMPITCKMMDKLQDQPGMTEKALEDIIAEARSRWDLFDALVIHRVGPLKPLDQIVLVAVTSAHRGEAFAACEFIIDYLKARGRYNWLGLQWHWMRSCLI